jgi:hypothetical protein
MLTPISFGRGRHAEPRLSARYTPGKHNKRYWSDAEIEIIHAHYEEHGADFCLSKLPGRSVTGVYRQAWLLGLKRTGRAKAQPLGTRLDETILQRWPLLEGRGAVNALADELRVKRDALSRRALALGLTLPHKKEPNWSQAEEDLLRRAPINNPERASSFFAAHGFSRSPASIMVRCKRRGLSRRLQGVLSATAAAKILGVDSKTMGGWCAEGWVIATRRGTQRLPQQGGDMWTIQPADLRRFVIEQIDRLDIRKVDKHAFVALLTAVHECGDGSSGISK